MSPKAAFTALFLASLSVLALAALMVVSDAAAAQTPCGMGPRDWCPAPAGDPCGRHRTADACRADPTCHGMPYRGESVVACRLDARGFGTNCPTVGCTSVPPRPAGR